MKRFLGALLLSLPLVGCGDDSGSPAPGGEVPVVEEGLGPRQLRLLTRREYEATVRDIFEGSVAASCEVDVDCDFRSESCVGGSCQTDPCELVTFVLPGHASAGAVVVAGTMNGWAPTQLAGGYPMAFEPSIGAWITKRALPDGKHSYKFVVDGVTWLADPENPNGEDDGFGGKNSIIDQTCAGQAPQAPSGGAITAAFPVESRPEHYPFDNAASAIVTSVHAEQYLRAGARLATEHAPGLLARFGCGAQSADDPCVREAVRAFGRLAFRRPLESAEEERLLGLVAAQPQLATGVSVFLRVVLSSPQFLYRWEIGEDQGDGSAKLTDYELASALSYTFVGSTPSETLLDLAESGALATPAGLEAAARDLLSDPRARDVMGVFAEQWLAIEGLEQAQKNMALYPEYDAVLAASMKRETAELFVSVALGEAPFGELFLRKTTTADGALAELIGASNGALPPERQAGLLAHASVLSAQAHSDQSSPVRRGVFVRTRLLCQTLPAPPANAGGVPEVDPDATTRERFSQHANDPSCNGCHQHIDPIGFGFEGFDAIGRMRTEDAGKPIDVSGAVTRLESSDAPAVSFNGLPELGALLAESRATKDCLALQAYRRAFGGLETSADLDNLAALEERFAAADYDVGELWIALARSRAFAHRRMQ